MKKKILLFGTFDFLHIGHIHCLRQAKKYADQLVVAVARDSVVKQLKGVWPIHSEKERKTLLEHVGLIDQVIFGDKVIGSYRVIDRVKPIAIAVGYDQKELYKDLCSFIADHLLDIRVWRLKPYVHKGRKSSSIRKVIQRLD